MDRPNKSKDFNQPRPQGLLLVQNGGRRNPWTRLPKWLQKFVRILSRKHDEMSSFRLNNSFQLQKTNRAAINWKQPLKKPFHRVSRDKILHDSWSISAALARGFSDCHFQRGKGPGDEVELNVHRFSVEEIQCTTDLLHMLQ